MRATVLDGDFLAWNDVLHEGPVRAGLSDEELRRERAGFLGASTPEHEADVLAALEARDRALAEAADVLLWFEADLYDQLQVIQILDRLARSSADVRMICIDFFPGVDPFFGLGQLTPEQLSALLGDARGVSRAELRLATAAWTAFRCRDPTAIEDVLCGDSSALPFLAPALLRHLEQFPSTDDGLSRSDRDILELVGGGTTSWAELFRAILEREEHPFLGDWWLMVYLERLMTGGVPLIIGTSGGFLAYVRLLRAGGQRTLRRPAEAARADQLSLTAEGAAVLAGRADHVELSGIDRWLGGVHLEGARGGVALGSQRAASCRELEPERRAALPPLQGQLDQPVEELRVRDSG